ncbi:lipase [Rhodococcus triatomae]|nr:lipase family protein [Rhodococcus triatomae]QNG21262.1 lipase [Rhodococcus triatomae]QNG25451.1 lipase [Rhodococcus triatomae]
MRRVARLGGVIVAALAMIAAALVVPPAVGAAPVFPAQDPDAFYAPPADLGARADGDVLRARTVPAPAYPGVDAWQILFRSTNSAGAPIAGVTTVLIPWGTPADRPLVSYQPFINSLGLQCAPSRQLFDGGLQEAPALNLLLQRGWAVAVPDHLGPTSAYGAAQLGGRLVLDGVRAAQRLPEAGLGRSPVGLAGYSGGGMATGWAAALAPTHAPEIDLVGAAIGGTPVDLGEIAGRLGGGASSAFGLGFAAAIGLEREYPTRAPLGDVLNDEGHALRDRMSNLCTDGILAAGAGRSIDELTTRPGVLDDSSVRTVMDENSLAHAPQVPRAPLYVWHGDADELVGMGPVQGTVGRYCASGARVQFAVLPGGDHGSTAVAGAAPAFAYLGDRFAGVAAPTTC